MACDMIVAISVLAGLFGAVMCVDTDKTEEDTGHYGWYVVCVGCLLAEGAAHFVAAG